MLLQLLQPTIPRLLPVFLEYFSSAFEEEID